MRYSMVVIFTGFVLTMALAQQAGTERYLRVANRMVEGINHADFAAIQSEYGASMADFTIDQTTVFFQGLIDRLGKPTKIDNLRIVTANRADFVMFFEKGAQDVQLYLDTQNKIAGYLFSEHAMPAAPVVEKPKPVVIVPPSDKQKTELALPFKGAWVVANGGDARELQNVLAQQFTFDFAAVDESGHQYAKNGTNNEDFFSFGKEVLAPADGNVVDVIDGVRDNVPGLKNTYALIGNAVIIQHKTNEYSVLSYLKQNSTRVHVGDKVTRGQVIALCGNSGGSTQPVIHYQLVDSPILSIAKVVKFYIEKTAVTKNGVKDTKLFYMPAAGDQVNPE